MSDNEEFRELEYWLRSEDEAARKWRASANVLELANALHSYRQQQQAKYFKVPQKRPSQSLNRYFKIPEGDGDRQSEDDETQGE